MKIDDKIKNEKLRYYFKREPAKISALFSGKIYKYKYLMGEQIPSPGKKKWGYKLSLHILVSIKHLKNK